MSLYIVTKVRYDKQGEIERVLWAQADGTANAFMEKQHDVDVDRVVKAFDHGDTVEIRFETPHGWVSGGKLLLKVLPDGSENVIEERGDEGRRLRNMPTF